MTKILLKQKMTKIPPKPRNDQNTPPKPKKNDQNTIET